MTARSYIRSKVDDKYSKKLLKGLDSYIRHIKKVNYHEFKPTDLANELNEVAKQRGIGQVSIKRLRQQLKADGYL